LSDYERANPRDEKGEEGRQVKREILFEKNRPERPEFTEQCRLAEGRSKKKELARSGKRGTALPVSAEGRGKKMTGGNDAKEKNTGGEGEIQALWRKSFVKGGRGGTISEARYFVAKMEEEKHCAGEKEKKVWDFEFRPKLACLVHKK